MGSIPTRGNKIFIYIFISSLWCKGKAWRWVSPLNMQCLQNSAKSGERSVLTLGSLCLLCAGYSVKLIWFDLVKVKDKREKLISVIYIYISVEWQASTVNHSKSVLWFVSSVDSYSYTCTRMVLQSDSVRLDSKGTLSDCEYIKEPSYF